jgi:thioredoxin reductase (NADPH)
MHASSPRAIIRQAADVRNRGSPVTGPGCSFRRPPAMAAGARNDTMSCLVWFAALVCSIEYPGENSVHKVIIIGSGCAGLTAAIYAARADLAPLVLDGYEPGGQLALTTMVENFPGFPDGILGPELIENSRKQAQRFGTEFQSGAVTSVDLSRRPFTVVAGKETYETATLIVAAGASARMLGIESERHLLGHGVSTCATCDGFFFRGKDIIVVGGGDTAMEEATFLTKFAKKVTLIHRRNEFRATKIMLDRARANEKIEFLTPYVIEEVHDMNSKSVEKVRLRNTDTNATSELDTSGVFVAIGHDPNTKLFKGQLDMDENGYLITHDGPKTNIEGVFAAGDVQDHHYRQAITAAGSGCMAAIEAERFLEGHKG